jgi:hypothetical protein
MAEPPAMDQLVSEAWPYSEPPTFTLHVSTTWPYSEPPDWSWFQPPSEAPNYYVRSATKVEIGLSEGSHEDLTAIEYAGDKAMGSGPGSDHLSIQTVLNTVPPTGILHHNKWWEVVIGLQEDEYQALFNTSVSDSLKACVMDGVNSPIGYLVITQESFEGIKRLIVYESEKTYLAGINLSKLVTEEGKYIVEVKFVCTGSRTIMMPNLLVYEIWGAREPPAMDQLVDEGWIYSEPPSIDQLVTEPWSE